MCTHVGWTSLSNGTATIQLDIESGCLDADHSCICMQVNFSQSVYSRMAMDLLLINSRFVKT